MARVQPAVFPSFWNETLGLDVAENVAELCFVEMLEPCLPLAAVRWFPRKFLILNTRREPVILTLHGGRVLQEFSQPRATE